MKRESVRVSAAVAELGSCVWKGVHFPRRLGTLDAKKQHRAVTTVSVPGDFFFFLNTLPSCQSSTVTNLRTIDGAGERERESCMTAHSVQSVREKWGRERERDKEKEREKESGGG